MTPSFHPSWATRRIATKTQLLFFEPEAGPVQAHPRFIQWPKPHEIQVRFTGDPVTYLVFDGEAIAYVPLTIAEDAPLGPTTLTVKPVFQVCDDTQCPRPHHSRAREAVGTNMGYPSR